MTVLAPALPLLSLTHARAFRGSVCAVLPAYEAFSSWQAWLLPPQPSRVSLLCDLSPASSPLCRLRSTCHSACQGFASWFFPPPARGPQDKDGLGRVLHAVCACGHKIRCSEWWQEHSRKQLPWSTPFPGRAVIKFFRFSKEHF